MIKRRIGLATALGSICGMVLSISAPVNYTDSEAAARSIKLSKSKVSIVEGKTYNLKVTVKPSKLKNKVTYSSSKKKVAKVNNKGKITAVKAGSAKITVKVKGTKLKKTCNVTVKKADATGVPVVTQTPVVQATATPVNNTGKVELTKVEIKTEDYVEVQVGESIRLETAVTPAQQDMSALTFSSDRDWVASVDVSGKVEGKYPGMATITLASKSDANVNSSIHVNIVDNSIPDASFNQLNDSIEHGTVNTITFKSDYTESGTQQARVWVPYDYSVDKKYNVLYCLHGGGGNMWYWTNDKGGANDGCSADKVLDNMYATGLMEQTIVVFPNGAMPYDPDKVYPNVPEHMEVKPFANSTDWFLTEYEVIYNLMPYIADNYNVMEGKEHTAVCGLSMGGGQTLELGLKHSDIFGYVGCFSASPFRGDEQIFVNSLEDAARLNSNLKLFTIMVGSEDGLANAKNGSTSKAFAATCRENELNFSFIEEPGLAHEDACWDRNLYKFMKYAFK